MIKSSSCSKKSHTSLNTLLILISRMQLKEVRQIEKKRIQKRALFHQSIKNKLTNQMPLLSRQRNQTLLVGVRRAEG